MFYLIIILICMLLIMAFNIVFSSLSIGYIVLAVTISTIGAIVIDGIFATIIRHFLPNKWFLYSNKKFDVSKKEQRFYEKLAIKKWKDKVIELGMFTNFRKNKVANPKENQYVERYIMECNYGVVVHIACIVVGFAVIFIYPLQYFYRFGLPVAIVNAVLNFLPYMILRYNVPKLQVLHKLNEKNNQNAKVN